MNKLLLVVSLLALAFVPLSAVAQEEGGEEATPVYISGVYYYCSQAKEEDADKVVKEKMAPVYNAAVEAGVINAWGWMAHRNGGKWRRLMFFSANGVEGTLKAAEHIYGKLDETMGDDNTLVEACPSHQDYMWEIGASSPDVASSPGMAAFSTYFFCDSTREERADEIVAENLAPVLNGLVENGNLSGWGWLEHYVGGKHRRLLTMRGASHLATLQARDYAVDVFYAEDNEAGAEFAAICANHEDYMWDYQEMTAQE